MPNHIQNRVTFDCSEEKLNEILTTIQKDSGENGNFGLGTVDFNKIIPMPDHIFKGLLGTEEKKIYGKNNWYDWSIENWGTKWNAYSFSRDGNTIGFQTAWSAPHPILAELTGMFPGVYITHEWADEDIGQNCGAREYLNGETVGETIPENNREAIEHAFEVWGYTAQDFEMCLNAAGTGYIRIDEETEYDLVELFGKNALYTTERITDEDIPQGFHCYHLRYDDEMFDFATVEPRVMINHAASVITTEPLDFGGSGALELTKENGINFTGAMFTLKGFIEYEKEALECTEEEGMTLG